jgi:hypothetical protein
LYSCIQIVRLKRQQKSRIRRAKLAFSDVLYHRNGYGRRAGEAGGGATRNSGKCEYIEAAEREGKMLTRTLEVCKYRER